MSIKSQTNNMRRLAVLLNFNLCNIHGKKECGPNGSKQVFLNVGKVFLRALARDLGLHDVTVSSNAGGIGVSNQRQDPHSDHHGGRPLGHYDYAG